MEVESNDKELFCSKKRCKQHLGTIKFSGQVLEIGNVEIFSRLKAFCNCGSQFIFVPSQIPRNYLDETAEQKQVRKAVLQSLNRQYYFNKKQNEHDD